MRRLLSKKYEERHEVDGLIGYAFGEDWRMKGIWYDDLFQQYYSSQQETIGTIEGIHSRDFINYIVSMSSPHILRQVFYVFNRRCFFKFYR